MASEDPGPLRLRGESVGPWERDDAAVFKVVVNDEEQYSIWPADGEPPLGWQEAGKTGSKQRCLAYIDEVWTDMRPLSLRRRTARASGPVPRS